MGTEAQLLAVGGGAPALDAGEAIVLDLELGWSRFRPDSELSQLNRAAGRLVIVSPATYDVVERAVDAWWSTGGLFDPTVIDLLEGSGYDRTFDKVSPDGPALAVDIGPSPGCAAIEFVPGLSAVRLPLGTRLDLGGIGKGLAADMAVEAMLAAGASGACANLGGDVRVSGRAPVPEGWVIDVDGHAIVTLAAGAVATTSKAKRRWTRGGVEHHHLIDPRVGAAARSELVSVSVVAADAVTADVLAKAALLAGSDAGVDLIDAAGVAALFHRGDRDIERVGGFERFEPATGRAATRCRSVDGRVR